MTRNTLIVGGAGMIGSHIAELLVAAGDTVHVGARSPEGPHDPPAITGLPRVLLDYSSPEIDPAVLEPFDTIVFTAGNDTRHVAPEHETAEFWEQKQSVGVPRFARAAKAAGVERFVQIGSYYHQLHPELADNNPYIAARKRADEGTRALAGDGFTPVTVNPPSIVGVIPGRPLRGFQRLISWVRGEREAPDLVAPPGGTNYMSARSLAQATLQAVERGEAGRAYLVGDENLTYRAYFQKLANAAGAHVEIQDRDEEHPFLPDRFIVQGRGNAIRYEPDMALQYDRNDVDRALREIVAHADATPARR